ncbi:outer membrane protein OmpA-like peptidoglycan-associated protein [Neorhizobium sp. R1-B]|uniref:OmpA family protein n=1 Tax=unclassified Neorhizobium TaxID=2629175 RepID=UPI001050FB2D|nr:MULTISPECIES: OmpA family protein [unclassified Neorhizobium]TCV59345.1 outer membrane protein OmpA-like peptidoglycan-associated protein [Neorhizobium sp. S3-V5DH]TDX71953.1 outer membrane protein OmpA-like peptidoglycan-associated protein [Neorhizobium sp. R1-B]
MSQKFRLFASVAVPFVSLPLMIQPVAALPLKPSADASPMSGVIQVQQEDPLILKKRKAQDEEGGAEQQKPRREQSGGAEQGGGERRQAPQAQQEEPPRRQRQAEPEAAPREAPAAEAPARERPQRRQQQADEGQGEGARPPQRRQQQQAAPESEQPAARETQQLRPPVAPEGNERPQRRDAQDKKAAPAENQAETPKPPRAKDRAVTPQAQPERPPRGDAKGQTPAPDSGTAQDARPRQPATESPAVGTRQTQDPQLPRPPAEGQAAPAQQQPTQEQPAQLRAQPQPAQTPEQVDRARQIARDPASAREGEQVTLPVENGAAVLDSAKERPARPRRDGDRPRRDATQQAEQQQLAPPKSDAEAQAGATFTPEQEEQVRAIIEERGERLDGRPEFERPQGWRFGEEVSRSRDRERDRDGARVIISIDDQNYVRHDDSRRFYDRDGRQPEYERLRDGQVREVIIRDDGTRIVTIRNRYGEIVRRTRVVRGGDEYVLYYAPELVEARRGPDYVWRDPGEDLPPMRLTVPIDNYIIDTSSEPDRDYYEFLEQPPVERVERVYTLDEVRYSARIRDKVPRIDLDTITFATGSAEIPMNQASSLRKVAEAINKVLEKDPSETFLIEGHTDAVGGDQDNLILSDERAESVARVLTDAFGIPPENLTTQGYGEQYLKVNTDGPNQENRRVTVRRITPLVKPVASNR